MGNHHSAVDREKEREKEREIRKEVVEGKSATTTPIGSRHEKHRSRTITATPLPPTETKINAEQTHIINNDSTSAVVENVINGDGHSKLPLSAHPSADLTPTSKEKEKPQETDSKVIEHQRPIKEVTQAVKTMDLGTLPIPTVEEIQKQASEQEPTPRFETIKNVGSETSIIDEDELKEADKSGEAQVPLILDWSEGGKKVAVAGTFTGWRKRVNLRKTNGGFSTILNVRPGTHRFHFLVDGEWRVSNDFATAVDSDGNLLNYLQAAEYNGDQELELSRSGSIPWPVPEVNREVWTQKIPDYLVHVSDQPSNYSHRERYHSRRSHLDDIVPPAVPRQLEKPFLNQNHVQKDDQSVLPNPAFVVLNHLGVASSIKNNVLSVSSTNRYRQKYITSILYKQVEEE